MILLYFNSTLREYVQRTKARFVLPIPDRVRWLTQRCVTAASVRPPSAIAANGMARNNNRRATNELERGHNWVPPPTNSHRGTDLLHNALVD